jgi:hypothetical protein
VELGLRCEQEAIKPRDKVSEMILALEPVTFRYNQDLDPGGIPQFGLIAEQVEKGNPDLVERDTEGKVSTVRYEAVNAMLLREFLKEQSGRRSQGFRCATWLDIGLKKSPDYKTTALGLVDGRQLFLVEKK